MSVICKACGETVPQESRFCVVCQKDAGFPNVRRAEKPDEVTALEARVRSAQLSAEQRGATAQLDSFVAAVAKSNAVMNRRLDQLQTWLTSDSPFFSSFHPQIRDGAIVARDNVWDEHRISAENTINPIYYVDLQIAALTLDDEGLIYYGPYGVGLKERLIAERASVFEENPFIFCQKHAVISGKPPPPGYRATWQARSELAKAKLGSKISSSTLSTDFPTILMGADRTSDKCDFIEVHIYERIHKSTIEWGKSVV